MGDGIECDDCFLLTAREAEKRQVVVSDAPLIQCPKHRGEHSPLMGNDESWSYEFVDSLPVLAQSDDKPGHIVVPEEQYSPEWQPVSPTIGSWNSRERRIVLPHRAGEAMQRARRLARAGSGSVRLLAVLVSDPSPTL